MIKTIIFLGADGSGKSTLLKNLVLNLKSNFIGFDIEVIHFRPSLRKKNNSSIVLPYDKKPHNFIISFSKLLVWYIEYVLFFSLKFIKNISTDCIVIFDRHLLDVKFDPLRYRMNKVISRLPFYYIIFPKPKIIFYINARSETINKRKNEVTLTETKIQLKRYQKGLQNITNVFFINSEEPVEICNHLIIKTVVKKLNFENFTNS